MLSANLEMPESPGNYTLSLIYVIVVLAVIVALIILLIRFLGKKKQSLVYQSRRSDLGYHWARSEQIPSCD